MFADYKVVVVCPAGRRRVADLMRRHIEQARPVVDELHWWVNTDDPADQEYLHGLARAAPDFYHTVSLPRARFDGRHRTINHFFRHAIDTDTIYVRIDDDVIWMDEHCIEELLIHRLRYPEAYLVYGNIVNSSRFMHLHQRAGAFDPGFLISYDINHPTNRQSVPAGLAAHTAFLKTLEALASGGERDVVLAPWKNFRRWVFFPGEHNDVNMISWFGRDFAQWDGICPIYEEKWICLQMPAKYGGRVHEACGAALCVHYASTYQWSSFDHEMWILEKYKQFAPPSKIVPQPDHADAAVMADIGSSSPADKVS